MDVRARTTSLLISPRKLRLVIDQVRGMGAKQAATVLEYMPKKGAKLVRKTLLSAMANAEANHDLNPDDLYVKSITADEGPRLKRVKAGARGRYKPRVRRMAHVTVVLAEREGAS
ncbi:MAG: 50S ribosomal protein L22 [Chloroflexi bacterium]|jgi:large subunit ribosomal protein L22|nr:50S ribosomal protein L22 [Chloroflexota bacterium]MDL1883466.1 50S ribosomal protein L22 [Anaerolineae bacterium CFX8]GIL14782.1 MAG: 50S ribosomal protein L22 [Chloroflexota bacterium]